VFAADVNAGCTKSVAQKIGKQRARFALRGTLDSVQAQSDCMLSVR